MAHINSTIQPDQQFDYLIATSISGRSTIFYGLHLWLSDLWFLFFFALSLNSFDWRLLIRLTITLLQPQMPLPTHSYPTLPYSNKPISAKCTSSSPFVSSSPLSLSPSPMPSSGRRPQTTFGPSPSCSSHASPLPPSKRYWSSWSPWKTDCREECWNRKQKPHIPFITGFDYSSFVDVVGPEVPNLQVREPVCSFTSLDSYTEFIVIDQTK